MSQERDGGLDALDFIEDDVVDAIDEDLAFEGKDATMQRRRVTYDDSGRKRLLVIGGAAAVVLIVLLVLVFGGADVSQKDLNALNGRLDQIEGTLNALGGMDARITRLETDADRLTKAVDKAAGDERPLARRIDGLAQKVARLTETVGALTSQPPKNPVPRDVPTTKATRYHLVRKGETLYAIARKYGLTLDDLLTLNNLKKGRAILPGQKLVVGPGR